MNPEIALCHGDAGPDACGQRVIGDGLAGVLDQSDEYVEGPAAQRNRNAVAREFALTQIQAKPAEADLILAHRIRACRSIQNN